MLEITKREADYIRTHLDEVVIATTARSKRARQKKRYVEETSKVKRILAMLRGNQGGCL
jgi:hypothetical protein